MTENQEKQIINLLTKAVNGVQRLEEDVKEIKSDVSELKSDVTELKGGQERMEKQMEIIGRSLDSLAGDNVKVKARVQILEERVN
jgi:phage shock protein A